MESEVANVKAIRASIKEKKRIRQRQRIMRIFKVLTIIVISFSLAVLLYWFDHSKYSRVNTVYVKDNVFLSDEEVKEIVNFPIGIRMYGFFASDLANKIPKDTIIEKISINRHWLNQAVTISVQEKHIVGYLLTDKIQLVAYDGSQKSLLVDQMGLLKGLPRITGFSDQQLVELASALARSDVVLFGNIAEIIRDPRSYDDNYLKVMMASGIVLNTSIYSLENLDAFTYKEIVNHLQPNQRCVVYDVFWKGSYSRECDSSQ